MSSRLSSANNNRNNSLLFSSRPLSSSSGFLIYNKNLNNLDIIEDKELIQKFKGQFIMSAYTDKSGTACFQNIPYDTYLIEIEDNKNFLSCASAVRFNKILEHISTNDNNSVNTVNAPIISTFSKFLGLRRQTDSFVEIFIYFNISQQPEEYNLQLITGSEVILKRCTDNIMDNALFEASENKLTVKENKIIKGRYEIVTVPGRYIMEICKNGYDVRYYC
jgi:hypothetical protein